MTPLARGIEVLQELVDPVETEGDIVITPYIEQEVGRWNQTLVEAGVMVTEMSRKLPSLEDLFLELTGGESID